MLTVVENQQELLGAGRSRDTLGRCGARNVREAERARHGGRDKLWTRQGAQLGNEYTIGISRQEVSRDLEAQSCLTDAASADQADQPMRRGQGRDFSEFGLSTDQFRNRLRQVRGPRGPRRRALPDGGDEPVPSPGQRLDEQGFPRVVPQHRSNGGDVALQHLRLNVRLRPQRLEELIVRHQAPGVLDEIPQHGKSLGCEKNALFSQAITTPEALVDGVEPEWRKLSHRTQRSEARRALAAMRSAVSNPSVKRR